MNGRKRRTTIHNSDQDFTIHAKSFVFFDKKTGTRRFEVEANANGSMPVNHVASLLALHCVTRGRTPRDFDVVVEAEFLEARDALGVSTGSQEMVDDPLHPIVGVVELV